MRKRGGNFRGRRLESDIRRLLSELIAREVNDARVQDAGPIVNQVQLSPDHGYGRVYVSFLKPDLKEGARDACLGILQDSAGYFRSQIGRRFSIRVAPELSFFYDETSDEMARIQRDLEEERQELERIRASAPSEDGETSEDELE